VRFLVDECLPTRIAGELCLDQIGTELDAGAIVVLTDQRIRIRLLPIVR